MNAKRFFLPLFLILIVGLLTIPLVAGAADGIANQPECPTVLQRGEINITIPAGETVGRAELQFLPCAGMNVQVTGGSMLETPVVINAHTHQDVLLLRSYLLEPQPGPFDVTLWWRVD